MDYSIIYECDTEKAEDEAFMKGYRSDVIIKYHNNLYKIYITTIERLLDDYNEEMETSGYYQSIPNTILISDITKTNIESIINKMVKCGYFDKLELFGF